MILGIETATRVCSVALQNEDGIVVERRSAGRGVHSENLFLFIEQLLSGENMSPDQLKKVLISSGPGTYTGLRIGAACVKGFLFGKNIPLYTLGTLAGFAAPLICSASAGSDRDGETGGSEGRSRSGKGLPAAGGDGGRIHAVLDARREHLYYQWFQLDGQELKSGKASIEKVEEVDQKLSSGDLVTGTGLERLGSWGNPDIRFYGESYISARNLIMARLDPRFNRLFACVDVSDFEPEYLSS